MKVWIMFRGGLPEPFTDRGRTGRAVIEETEMAVTGLPPGMPPESVFRVFVVSALKDGVFLSDGDWVAPSALVRIWYK